MAAGDDFARILDDKVGAELRQPLPGSHAAPRSTWRYHPSVVFASFDLGAARRGAQAWPIGEPGTRPGRPDDSPAPGTHAPVFGSRPRAASGVRPAPDAPRTAPVRFPSPRERRAIDRFRRLGAPMLAADASDGDLRHAFRSLARRYHPDAHPGATPDERAVYGRLFAELCDAYRVLRGG